MTAHLRRQGHRAAACTIDRLMRDEGLAGLVRGGHHRTTIPADHGGRRAPDLLDRDFTAAAPNQKWVTDFTYCRTWSGFVYVAFVIDCFSRAQRTGHSSSMPKHRPRRAPRSTGGSTSSTPNWPTSARMPPVPDPPEWIGPATSEEVVTVALRVPRCAARRLEN